MARWRSSLLMVAALCAVFALHQATGSTTSWPSEDQVLGPVTARKLQGGGPTAATGNFTSITIPLDVCGYVVSTPFEQMSGEVLGTPWKDPESSPNLGFQRSLKSFIEMTSFGALKVPNNTHQNLVLSKPVPVRGDKICLKGNPNVTVDCSVDAIAEEAEMYAANVLGIDMTQYAIKIFFLSNKIPGCSSASLARVGCFTNSPGPDTPSLICRTWNFEGTTKLLINLVSYNFGVLQAQLGDGLGTGADWSSPMTVAGYYCHNAYHSHYLGWTESIKTLDVKNTTAGNWTEVRLPPRAAEAVNYVLLTGIGLDLYVSYIAPVGWEKEDTDKDRSYKLLVHRRKSLTDSTRSVLLAVLGGGEQSTPLGSTTFPHCVVRMAPGPTLNGTTAEVCLANDAQQCGPNTGTTHPPPKNGTGKPHRSPRPVRSPKPPAPSKTR